MVQLDRKRKGKKLSNEDWTSPTDPDAKIARMKDGSTHLAFKPEHAVDLDTGVVVAAPIHSAEAGDTATLGPTLEEAQKNLAAVGLAPTSEDLSDLVADKGHHSRDRLKGTSCSRKAPLVMGSRIGGGGRKSTIRSPPTPHYWICP